MHTGPGRLVELRMEDGCRYGRIFCADALVPAPGQYLLASSGPDSILPVPIFYTDSAPQGFIGLVPEAWKPGDRLSLRGPLGHGFSLPISARNVGLIPFEGSICRLRGLVRAALLQKASVVVVSDEETWNLPDEVEGQPTSALYEILKWADFAAVDLRLDDLPRWKERLGRWGSSAALPAMQVLVHTDMPCGGIAECGVCALTLKNEWRLVCKDGPVFDLREL